MQELKYLLFFQGVVGDAGERGPPGPDGNEVDLIISPSNLLRIKTSRVCGHLVDVAKLHIPCFSLCLVCSDLPICCKRKP